MSSFQERHRKEEDPFAQEAPQKEDALLHAHAMREREEEDARQAALALNVLAAAKEAAPHVQAELPQDGQLSQESAERLFQHYVEKNEEEDGEEEETQTTAQPDVRQRSREVWRRSSQDVTDMIQEGMDGDFVADSMIVAADLDTHPAGGQDDAWRDDGIDNWTGRRRRRGDKGPPADPLAPSEAQPAEERTQNKESR
ncbi:MAG: hypothetical protein JNJ46_05250 [Myxococcales bacterium]|jgi:polyhydroxyalkanoate synthesis regulator phasin|nr:hypothetical protein [Myxococcales bacterium]